MGAADRPRRATRRATERPDPGVTSFARRHARSRRAAARAWSRARAVAFPSPADRAGVSEDVVNSQRRVTFSIFRSVRAWRRNASPHHLARSPLTFFPSPTLKNARTVSHERTGRGVLRSHLGVPQGDDLRDAGAYLRRARDVRCFRRRLDRRRSTDLPVWLFHRRRVGRPQARNLSTSCVVRDDRGVSAVARFKSASIGPRRAARLFRVSERVQIFSSPRTANDG